MVDCRSVKQDLTAWCDGELSAGRTARIRQHLTACPACAAEVESLAAAIRWQRQALAHMVAGPELSSERLAAAVRRALAAEPEPSIPLWSWLLRPLAIGGAAAMLGVILLFSLAGGPRAVLIPLGMESPPVAVSSEPDLFENYQLIQHLDALENYDTVDSVPLDEDQGLHEG